MTTAADGILFKQVMAEMRAHTLNLLANPHIGTYVPSARLHKYYLELQSLPLSVSNSGELDDAIKQIRATANTGATSYASNFRLGITKAASAYQSDPSAGKFNESMNLVRQEALGDLQAAIGATYDKADAVAENLSPSQQQAIVKLMDTLSNTGFNKLGSKVSDFILDIVRNTAIFIQHASGNIKSFFENLMSFIKNTF